MSASTNNATTIPSLRFAGGDVLITLSDDPDDTLLVHSSVCRQGMPSLAPSFQGQWATGSSTKEAIDPLTGASVKVYLKALKLTGDTFLLVSNDEPTIPPDMKQIYHFQSSDTSTGVWDLTTPGRQPADLVLSVAVRAYKVLFAILYDLPVTMAMIVGGDRQEDYTWASYGTSIGTLCAYAEYYECLSKVVPVVAQALAELPNFWRLVAHDPVNHIRLSTALRIPEVYFDALRHLFGRTLEGDKACRDMAEELLNKSRSDTFAYIDKLFREQAPKIDDIKQALRGLAAPENHRGGGGDAITVDVVCTIFTDWLDDHIRRGSVLTLNAACEQLLAAAQSEDDKANVLLRTADSVASSTFNKLLNQARKDRVRAYLGNMVLRGAVIVEEAFEMKEVPVSWYPDGSPASFKTYRRAHVDDPENYSYFTYLPMVESDVPWAQQIDGIAWQWIGEINADTTPASAEWMKAVGT